jgi:hypothetical protein
MNMRGLTGVIFLISMVLLFSSCGKQEKTAIYRHDDTAEISFYTCGMHPSVKVLPEEYRKGKVNCPICNMKLTPIQRELKSEEELIYYGCGMEGEEHVFRIIGVKEEMTCPMCGMDLIRLSNEEADKLKGVASRVKVKGEQARLAGVKTEPVRRLHLFKEIRTVGKVAYDPALAITQEEFISAITTYDKIREGGIPGVQERAGRLVESSKRKLRLLGLSQEQIEELERTKKVQTSLILPEEKMWIYGDLYEYEMSWVKTGAEVKVTTSSLPGQEFRGVISSVNPVIDPKTRSVRFRAEVGSPDLSLKPEMYVDVVIMSMYKSRTGEHMVLAIPKEAVLDTGTRRIVWIDKGDGEYEGKIVETGPEATVTINNEEKKVYPVLKGLSEGEPVVTKANFLIDSQSQLSGTAASAYGGAISAEEEMKGSPGHQH